MDRAAHYPGRRAAAPHFPSRAPARALAAALGAALLLAGCGGGERVREPAPPAPGAAATPVPRGASGNANDVLMRALGLIGTPYRFGGNTPGGGFDCSGLVGYVFLDAAGLPLPRTSQQISEIDAPRVDRDRLAPGDLVFFGEGPRRVSHVGIYVGEGRFVHAPTSGGTVRIDPLSLRYWDQRFLFGRRPLR